MSDTDQLTRLLNLFTSDNAVPCPHCEHEHSLSDPDTSSAVVSYWGDEVHEFTCESCNQDFVVNEQVTRRFTTAKDHDTLMDTDD